MFPFLKWVYLFPPLLSSFSLPYPPILSCPFCHCNFLWNPEIWNCVYRCHIVCNLLANGLGPDVCWFMRFILLQVKAFGFILLTLMSSCHPSSPACWGPTTCLYKHCVYQPVLPVLYCLSARILAEVDQNHSRESTESEAFCRIKSLCLKLALSHPCINY